MSQMQTLQDADHASAGAAAAARAGGLFESAGQIVWRRSDWPRPVASFNVLQTTQRRTQVRDKWVDWVQVEIPELLLERSAALLLLQGERLSQLLIPNHSIEVGGTRMSIAHLLLRVDPWEVWRPAPCLTGLMLAQLGSVPTGIAPTELLAALASDSALH